MLSPDQKLLVVQNINLARSVAYRYVRRRMADVDPAVDEDDLLAWAYEGLCVAAERYNPGLGIRFATFAWPHITGAVLRYLKTHATGGIRVSHLMPRHRRPRVASIDAPLTDAADSADFGSFFSTAEDLAELVVLQDLLDSLPPQIRSVVQLRMEGLLQVEVASRLGCGQAAVSRREREARHLLQAAIGA